MTLPAHQPNEPESVSSDALLINLGHRDRAERQRAIEKAAEAADPSKLVRLIAGTDTARRNSAIDALARGGRRSVPALLQALEDSDPAVVMFAAATLGKTRDASVVPALVRLLQHDDINVAQAAIESLGQLRAVSAMDALAPLLSADPWLRFAAVHCLGEIGHPSGVPTLVAVLSDEDVRHGAVDALGKIGSPDALAALLDLLHEAAGGDDVAASLRAIGRALAQTPDPETLKEIAGWVALTEQAREKLGPRLLEILGTMDGESGSVEQAQLRLAALEFVRVLRLPHCYEAMVAAASDPTLADALLAAAVDIGSDLAPHLVQALGDPSPTVRLVACRALGAALLPQGAAAVSRLFSDSDEEIRAAALSTLARLHAVECLPAMLACLADDSPRVQGAAIEALSRMDASLVTLAIMQSPAIAGRQHLPVLAIMRDNPHSLQRAFLESALRHSDEDVRRTAVAALAAQPIAELVSTLEGLLDDPSEDVRREVILALSAHRCERTRELLLAQLERHPETRLDVLQALRRVGDDRVAPNLVALYPSCGLPEQLALIDTLGALEAPWSEPFLARLLMRPDPEVRRHAVGALARIGTPPALQHLNHAVRDSDPKVRLAVADALASCPHPIARDALERLSLDAAPTVAAAARRHLGA